MASSSRVGLGRLGLARVGGLTSLSGPRRVGHSTLRGRLRPVNGFLILFAGSPPGSRGAVAEGQTGVIRRPPAAGGRPPARGRGRPTPPAAGPARRTAAASRTAPPPPRPPGATAATRGRG